MLSLAKVKKLPRGPPEATVRMAGSVGYDQDYGGSSRDTLAETFVTSFLGVQGEVSRTVQKGLTVSFELDAYIRQCQVKIDGVLEHLSAEQNGAAKDQLVASLNALFDEMCTAQIRATQKWNELEDQISTTVAETESHWKRAEPFFRSKQKRNDTTSHTKTKNDVRNKASRKLISSLSFPVQPTSSSQPRPSLLPKRPPVQGAVRKRPHSDVRKQDKSSNETTRSVTPERSRPDKKVKSSGPLTGRKSEKKEKDVRGVDLKEKKIPTSPAKKKRISRPSMRPSKKPQRAHSDESFTESESSGAPYDKRVKKNSSSDSDKDSIPDEDRYCTCRGISYGHMVGCDYDGCKIEWFHFTCVGLKAKPRGKWFCPDCRDGDNTKISKFAIGEKADDLLTAGKTAA
ncbi:hypothetical protein RvY_15651 [Ramazzottius varieornatus]|uniref:PHD-type domain-containing protein n=1 Tax=Ramazzottius varieornatus TaxID=947166 RepID=A0A1D1VYU1_RAMVA|nr:hypothetical protein RvY_15651 [Ramazzottius varieornatus]